MGSFSLESQEVWCAGVIGIVIYGISSLICCWRSYLEFLLLTKLSTTAPTPTLTAPPLLTTITEVEAGTTAASTTVTTPLVTGSSSMKTSSELLIMKVCFYISLTLNSVFELIYSISLVIENSYTLYGYTCHLLGLWAIVIAFSTSIYQWCSILFRINERKKYIYLLQIFLGINVIATCISVGVLFSVGNVSNFAEKNNWAYVLVVAVNGLSLFFLTCSLLIYGRVLAKRFQVDPNRNISKLEIRRKYQSLLRINTILGICCVCFFIRVCCLGIATSDSLGTNIEEKHFPPVWWFLLNSWIPTIPAWTLLYTWRSKNPSTEQRTKYAPSSEMKQPRGSSTLSSTDDRTTPLLFHQSDILSACSDNESDNMNSNSYNITISSDYDEEKYREDSANEAYMQYTRNLYDERLSAE